MSTLIVNQIQPLSGDTIYVLGNLSATTFYGDGSQLTGVSGGSGTSGTSGVSGANGTSGTSGESGTSGTSGANGANGTSGESGTSGTSGENGTSGTSGISSNPSGSDGEIQYNSGGTFSSNFNLRYDENLNVLNLNGTMSATTYYGDGSNLTGIVAGAGAIPVSYADLVNNMSSSALTPGASYIIVDFRTCYDQPDYDYDGNAILTGNYKQGDVEPLIVIAVSEQEISTTAYSALHPKDRIQYDWSWNTTEITGGNALGRITERIDEFNNRTDYDHRSILFKRYKTYFYELNNELQGRIDINGTDVIGRGTNFMSDLSPDDVIYVLEYDKYFKIDTITSDSGMTINGNSLIYANDLTYYYAESQVDGTLVTVPYTHTRMTNPPLDPYDEASLSDFLMDGAITGGTIYFGTGSTYFTNMYPGLFVLTAYDTSINTYSINGNLGADGSGSVDFTTYSSTGTTGYTSYIKRVYNAGDPTVNQIITINTDGTGVQYDYSMNTDSNFQKLYYLTGATQIHYLLTSTRNGIELTIENIQLLIENYLSNVDSGSLSNTLSNVNLNYSAITSHITDIFYFNDVEGRPNSEGGEIDDGGNDMYDGGNMISTNVLEANYPFRCYEIMNNNIPDDNFFYREFKTFQYDDEIIDDGHATSINNHIGNNSEFFYTNLSHSDFILANNVFDKYSYSNTLGDRSYNNSTYRWFNRNRVGNRFYNNRVYGGFYANVIGEYCYQNTFSGYIWRNSIGEDFNNNKIGNDFQNNFIRNAFNDNVVTENFYKNSIGNGFNNNEIWAEFYGNLIGNAYNGNKINGGQTYQNIIEDRFQGNVIDGEFYDNKIGVYFQDNKIYNSFYRNVIGNNFNGNYVSGTFQNNQIGNQFNNNQTLEDFVKNVILNGFNNNYIGSNFDSNKIGNGFNNNHTNNYFKNNVIGDYFEQNYYGFFNGWRSLENTLTRNFSSFRYSLGGNVGYNIVGTHMVMHDTVNDTYYRIKFTNWQQYAKGGGFSYQRTQFDPVTGADLGGTVYFTRDNYREDQIDVISPGVLEIKRNSNGGIIYNSAAEGTYNQNVSPQGTEWNSQFNSGNANFERNVIGNNFYYNHLDSNFMYNSIKDYFYENTVKEGFGFGYSASQGNKIGNYFYNNLIGEYFYNNTFCDGFFNNQVGNYFQMNNVKINGLNSIDFRAHYGNISAFTYSANGSGATDGSYTALAGTTNGNGLNATFDVVVSASAVTNVSLNSTGITYAVNDTILILGTQIGGTDGVDDVTITVTAISQTPSVYENYACELFNNSGNVNRLSFYDQNDVLTIKKIDE